jgi:hypothetical protein
MAAKFRNWFQSQRAGVRLALLFSFNLLLLLAAELFLYPLFSESDHRGFGRQLFSAFINAIFLTLFLDWKDVKAVVRKKDLA